VEHLAIGDGNIQWESFFDMLDRIAFSGKFGVDIGGAESGVDDLDGAFQNAAQWLEKKWFNEIALNDETGNI
jgi:hypothetical protein